MYCPSLWYAGLEKNWGSDWGKYFVTETALPPIVTLFRANSANSAWDLKYNQQIKFLAKLSVVTIIHLIA